MTTIELDAHRRPEPDRDRWGRYLLPNASGNRMAHQRVTTFIGMIADTYNLSRWQQRMVMVGLVQRHDLYASVASLTDPIDADKSAANKIAEQAIEAAQGSKGANLGTSLHAFTERIDMGEDFTPPPPWDADVQAYRHTLSVNGISLRGEYVERIVILDDLAVAGTLDRIVEVDGRLYIADLKTGKDPASFPHDICLQLACYAHADAMVTPDGKSRVPMPDVDQRRALVVHLPPAKAQCDLYWFDIAAGWEMIGTCAAVKAWRKRGELVEKFKPTRNIPPTPTPPRSVVPEGDLLDPFPALQRIASGFTSLGIVEGSPDMARWNRWVREGDLAGVPFRFCGIDDAGNATNPERATRRRSRIYSAGARLIAFADDDDAALDVLVAVLGPTTGGTVGATLGSLDESQAKRLIDAVIGLDEGSLLIEWDVEGRPFIQTNNH